MQCPQFLENMVECTPPIVKSYINDSILVLKPDFYIDFSVSLDNCFNFSMAFYNNAPPLTIDNKTHNLPKKSMLAINPDQLVECHPLEYHTYKDYNTKEYISFFIDRDFLNEISHEVCNKRSVFFENNAIIPDGKLYTLLNMFICESEYKNIGNRLALDSISSQIVLETLRSVPNNIVSICSDKVFSAKNEINKVIEFMHENISENITLEELCNIAHLSRFYFIKIFRSYTGKTPHEYYMDIKLEKAKTLLKQEKLSITEIAYMLGFSSHSYFSSQFKKKTGCSPFEYQKNL